MFWSRYNAMLVANSVILAAIGLTGDATERSFALDVGLPLVGILLCLLWVSLVARGFDYFAYWILSARELEERYMAAEVVTVSRGGPFSSGKPVSFVIDGKPYIYRMSRASLAKILPRRRIKKQPSADRATAPKVRAATIERKPFVEV
jgi:hypothetical protein